MAGGLVQAIVTFLKGKDGEVVQVSAANPLPVSVLSGGGSTTTTANPGANATQAGAVQGVDGGKPVGVQQAVLPAGASVGGNATTTSGGLSVPANLNRRGLVGQNLGGVNIGFNEHGGTAAIGTAGTYTVPPGSSFSISTNKLVNFIAASGTPAVTMTEY